MAIQNPAVTTTQRFFLMALWLSQGSLTMTLRTFAFDVPYSPQRMSSLTQISAVMISTTKQQQRQQELEADRIEQAVLQGLDYQTIADMVENYSRRFNIQHDENIIDFNGDNHHSNSYNNLSPNDDQQQQQQQPSENNVSPTILSSDSESPSHFSEEDDDKEDEVRKILNKAAQCIEEAFRRGLPFEQVRDIVDSYARVKMRLDQQQQQEVNTYRHREAQKLYQPSVLLQDQQPFIPAPRDDSQHLLVFLPKPPMGPPPRKILLLALAEVAAWNADDEGNDNVTTTTKAYRIINPLPSQQNDVVDVAIEHKVLMP